MLMPSLEKTSSACSFRKESVLVRIKALRFILIKTSFCIPLYCQKKHISIVFYFTKAIDRWAFFATNSPSESLEILSKARSGEQSERTFDRQPTKHATCTKGSKRNEVEILPFLPFGENGGCRPAGGKAP
jgi:hypothetical protein